MLRKLRKNYRRLVAFMLTIAMTFTNVGTNLNVAFAAGEEQEALFLVDGSELREAIQYALDSGETFAFSSLELKAKSKSLKTSYEKLIGGKNGKVYQLDVDVDERYAPEGTSVEVFYNAGTEDVVFLFINESDMVVKFRANVDGYETARVTINPNAANVDDPDASYVEDYDGSNMIDDMRPTLGAEVLNPTTEADAGEGTDAEADETTEAVEGPAGETSAEDGSGTEETSQAEETGADQNSEPAADETSEAGTTDGAETEGSQAGEADETTETTGAAGNEAGETSGAAGSGEETTAADETTVEETGAQESQPETETETADNEADAEGEALEEAGGADAADEAEAGAGEAQPEAGSATASISMRRLHQVASSVQVLDDADIVIDPEDVPGDETPEIREDSQVEVETGESTQAPEEEEPETTAEAETEEESEETREAETEETEPAETEATSAADSQETTGADAENGGTSAADESSAADDDTDATEESGDADIIIEETTPADGTDATDTPVEVETPAETTPAEEDNAGGSQAPEGNGDASEVPDFDEGQELEDDINGTLENLGDLNGKAYNTVTIWGSANARAYKVAAKDLEGVAAVEGTYSVSYTVDPVGTANVRGAKSIEEGQDLYFYVDPQVGYQITSVTANGAELETIDAAEVEASALAGHDYVYMVEAVEEDLEIVASLVEIEGMSHPEFNPDPVNRNGVIITVHAEEGIIPAGTELQVTEVTSQIGDAVKEKLENESDITVQEVIAYDINLVLDGRKLDNSWSENGYVDVSFSGSRIRRLTEEADTVSFYAADDDNRATMSARNAAQVTADNLKLEAVGETDVEDTSVSEVSFEAEHFTIYVGIFETQDTTVGDRISVDVAYVYENGTQAKPSQTVVIEKESGRDSYEFSVNVDAEEGYSIEIFEEETDSAVAYTVEGKTVKATLGSDIEQSHVTIKLVANEAGYKIVSHFPQLDGTEKTTEDDTCIGKVGKLTNVTAPEVPGFTAEEVRNQVVTADGNAVVHIQYARDEYTLVYNTQGGSYVKSKKGLYEQTVEVYNRTETTEQNKLVCGKEEHKHTYAGSYYESGYFWDTYYYYGGCYPEGSGSGEGGSGGATRGNVICGKSEHSHTSTCRKDVTVVGYTPQPVKDGYDFAGWYKDAACRIPADSTVTFDQNFTPDADNKYQVTVYAKWEAHTVNYTIAYFRQVWDNDANSGYYVYDGSEPGTARVGTELDGSAVRNKNYTLSQYNAYSQYSHADTAVVKADGTTVVNVYYDLIKYTFVFNLNDTRKEVGTITMDGKQYHGSNYKIENVVLGQNIGAKWPTPDNTTRSNGDNLNTWSNNRWNNSFKTKIVEVTTELLKGANNKNQINCSASWMESGTKKQVNYWFEKTDGTGYEKSEVYSQSFVSNEGLLQKEIYGFNKIGVPSGYESSRENTYNFYYDRKTFEIEFHNDKEVKTDTNIRFGADISGNNYVPDRPANVDADYTFGGWYDNAGFNGDPYSFTTMPAGNVVLYAKWEAPDRTVTVVFNNAETNEEIIIKKGDKLSSVKTPEKPGFDFAGWYTDESFADGSEFDINEPINTDTTIYAKWEEQKRADCVVRYVVKDSAAEGGYRDIMEPKEIKGALVGSVLLEEAVPYEDADGNKYAVNKAFQDYTVRNAGEGNEILFIYTAPSSLRYDVQYTYTDAEGKTTVVKEERDIAAGNAASFNVYRNPEIVKELNGLGYYVEERFVPVVLNAEEPNIVIFHLVIKPYTITYEGLGSITGWEAGSTGITNPNPGTYTLADSTITLINPVREGFTFNGWKLTAGEVREGEDHSPMAVTIEIAADGSKSKGDLAFRATWTESSYTVHYDTKGGTPTFVDMENVKWSQSGLLPATDPTRNGYTFAGWKYNTATVTSASRYSDLAGKDTVSEITLTAQWEIDTTKTVDIIYVTENEAKGTVSNPKDTIQIVSGQTLTGSVAQPTSGYMFAGWYKDGQMVYDKETLAPDQIRGHLNTNTSDGTYEATEFVAKFEKDPKETAIVTYVSENTDMGTVDPEANTIHIVDAEGLTGSTATAKEGYVCIGWYIGTDLITPNAKLKPEDAKAKLKVENGRYTATTFTAKFAIDDENRVEVKYESLKHGTVDNGLDSIRIVDADGLRGSTATANPGYRFIGWYKGDNPTPISQNVKLEPDTAKAELETSSTGRYAATTFTAKFVPDEKQTVKVTYTSSNPSGGSVTPSENNIQIVTADDLTGSSATVETGYRFAGWYKGDDRVSGNLVLSIDDAKAALNKSKDGETYAATEFVARFELDDSQKVKVYYTVSDKNMGTVTESQNEIQIVTGEVLTGSVAEAKAGYKFVGWYKGKDKITDADDKNLNKSLAAAHLNKDTKTDTYLTTTFTAKFELDETKTVDVFYKSSNPEWGTVTHEQDRVQIVTGEGLRGSEARAKAGYRFVGWYKGTDEIPNGKDKLLTPDKALENLTKNPADNTYDTTTFTAVFELDDTQKVLVSYKTESESKGTVTWEEDRIQVVTGEELKGSQAVAKPGYRFAGWFKGTGKVDNRNSAVLSPEAARKALDTNADGTYKATTFTATFEYDPEQRADVIYRSENPEYGSVNRDKDSVQALTGDPIYGSTATAKAGYKFIGWYKGNEPISEAAQFIPEKELLEKKTDGTYDTTTFTAKFELDKEQLVDVVYESEDISKGTVDNPGNKIQIVTAEGLSASTATKKAGYVFTGWFKGDQEITQENTLDVTKATAALDRNPDNTYKKTTFTATFALDASKTVPVTYESSNTAWGTVDNTGDNIQIVTADGLNGSEATALAGYKFVGWFKENADKSSSDKAVLSKADAIKLLDTNPDGTYKATKFIARFQVDENQKTDVFYRSANETMGTVTNTHDTIQIRTAAGLNGSVAKARDGYRFVGWYNEEDTEEPLPLTEGTLGQDAAKAALNTNPADGTYTKTTFVAVFELDPDQTTTVTYESKDPAMGTVGPETSNTIQIATGDPVTGSTATPAAGYKFDGWYRNGQMILGTKNPKLDAETAKKNLNYSDEKKVYTATTFTAQFSIDDGQTVNVTYVSEDGSMGSVDHNLDEIQIRTGDTLKGSSAKANPGYTFLGWYKGDEKISDSTKLEADVAKVNLNTENGTYDETEFTAKFAEDEEVLLQYVSEDEKKGTVDPASEKVKPATGEAKGSVATAKPGYHFEKWTLKEQAGASLIQKAVRAVAGQGVSRDPMLTRDAIDQVAKDKDNLYMATTFQAHFAEDGPVTIQYQVAAADGAMGSVSKTSETLKPVSDNAAGSVAQPVTGYKLVSWTNEANQVVSTSETFVPARDADGLNFRQTYTAHFAPLDNLSYEVHYLYDGVEDHARADGKDGNAVFGTSIDFSRTETEFNGQNYIFEKTEGPTTVTEVSANNKLYVHYTLDVIGGEDPDPENPDPDRPRPDQIPDKYQIRFDYKSAGNGTVNGVLTEVHTIYEVLKDKETGEITATGKPMPAKPDADVAVKAAEGYAFDYWTTTENSDKDSSENMSAFAGKTYTKSTEFTAHFDTDKIGEKDPNQPDNIPDKYQITVTHKVVNGGWNDNREESEVVKVLTLKKGSQNAEDGTADYTGPEAGQKPAAGYKTGGWDVISPRTFRKADDNHVYTYTYAKDSFKLTVRHEYEALDGTQTVDTIVNNVDTEFQTPLSYTTRMRENFVFAGVAVEGMTDTNTAQQIVEGTMPAQAVIITFHYQEDRIGNPENPEKPDGIPDKYQITFTYQAAANGTVTGTTTEVMTIQDITRDPATGTITAVGPVKAVSPTQPSVVTANEGYYFLNWSHGSDILADDKAVRAGSYTTSETFIANFKENPDNAWTAEKWVTNLPSRGYFRVGEDAHFIIEVTNTGNRPLKDVKIHETLKGAVISASTNGSYTLVNGDAVITELAVGRSVRVEATYKVTREDLFNREFRNIVVTSATIDREEPGAEPVDDVTADTGRIPAGAQGSGGSSGGGGSSSGTRSPGTGGGPTGGPGTVTIDPEAVPLANLPEMGNDDILALIDDEEVPLAALPKTGQAGSAALMLMISSMMLAAFAVVTRKKEEEQ